MPSPSPTPIDRTDGAMTRAIYAYRADPSPANHAALMDAQRAHVRAFYAEQTTTFQEMTR